MLFFFFVHNIHISSCASCYLAIFALFVSTYWTKAKMLAQDSLIIQTYELGHFKFVIYKGQAIGCILKQYNCICFSTLLYLKFLLLWAMVILADFILEFRFEFLWPFWLLLRSVYDSFKYQGLVSIGVMQLQIITRLS